ncbi:hypothetical protein CEXT_112721 [Caerostris extrusa]|uniref:Uncharacterized protein n=1 Tax=Caerostris extrusa TaxID=172846 RepID=A0AAV4M5Y5_CAEEX|nr:hypothetical protein CEXT_112721 [Caerostris extrusa]
MEKENVTTGDWTQRTGNGGTPLVPMLSLRRGGANMRRQQQHCHPRDKNLQLVVFIVFPPTKFIPCVVLLSG